MKFQKFFLWSFLIGTVTLGAVFLYSASYAQDEIIARLVVRNPLDTIRVNEPITASIPFSVEENVTDINDIKLFMNGNEKKFLYYLLI